MTRAWVWSAGVVACVLVLVFVPHPWEGPVLLALSDRYERGVHLSDLLAVLVGAVVLAAVWRRARRTRQPEPDEDEAATAVKTTT